MSASTKPAKTALVVHADMDVLSIFQASLAGRGFAVVLAHDLPTALLALTQHVFDVAIISSRLAEGSDIWPLAGVVHMVLPRAFVGVLAPETDILTLQYFYRFSALSVARSRTVSGRDYITQLE